MTLNTKIARTGLYLLAQEMKQARLPHVLVGGLAAQVAANRDFKDYLRPTIDADISVYNQSFSDFRTQSGGRMANMAKNKFGLGYHLINGHFSNGVELIQDSEDGSKGLFWLHFNRLQPELYEKMYGFIQDCIENQSYTVGLEDIGITPETITTKARVNTSELDFRVLNPETILELKVGRIKKKMGGLPPKSLDHSYEMLGRSIIENGTHANIKDFPVEMMYLTYMRDSNDDVRQPIQKDIYDFLLLTGALH